MDEVSCRAFSFFQEAERQGWISINDLMVGSSLERGRLENPLMRADWDRWATITDRFAELIGHHRLRESAKFAIQPSFAGEVLSKLGPLFSSQYQFYKIAFGWAAPSIFRCINFEVTQLSPHRLRVKASLQSGYRDSLPWFEIAAGCVERLPTFLGMKAAITHDVITGSSLNSLVTLTPRTNRLQHGKRLLQALFVPEDISRELTFQQEQLRETYQELSRRERAVFGMLEHLPDSIVLFRDGKILYANSSFSKVVGVEQPHLLGEPLLSFVEEEHREKFQQAIIHGTIKKPAHLMFSSTNGPRLLRASPLEQVLFEGENVRGMFATDITEEALAKESLRHHEETLSAMSSSLSEIIARVDREGVLLDLFGGSQNPDMRAVKAMKGQSLRSLLQATPFLTLTHVEDTISGIRESLDTQKTITRELSSSDWPLVFECQISPIVDQSEALLVVRDISNRREQERALAISERMASLGTLVAGLGHEINNPLTWVLGNQQALLEVADRLLIGKQTNLQEMRQLIEESLQGALRIRDLVRSLSNFSRVDNRPSGKVKLNEAIEEALRMVRNQLQQKARIVTELSDVGEVRGEYSRVVQVFVNLLVNSLQALDEEKENVISLRTERQGERVIATVKDTGHGIKPADLARIFDHFFTTKPVGQGTGLGLAIVHRTVEEFGGSINVESREGQGTLMRLTFLYEEPSQDLSVDVPKEGAPRRRVLIIDDEPLVTKALTRTLQSYETLSCQNGEEALSLLRTDAAFDVILCDLNMPNGSGIDVFEGLVGTPLASRFLFMTGGSFTARTKAFVKSQNPILIEKTSDPDEILKVIESIASGALQAG